MISCKDFAPRITKRGPFGGPAEYESFSEVVSAVNQWIDRTIQVINVETVVLPNSYPEGTSDGVHGVTVSSGVYAVMVSSGMTIKYFQCVRV